MKIIELRVSTDGDGNGTATAPHPVSGYIHSWYPNFSASADAGIDTTLSYASVSGEPDFTIDSITSSNTDVRRYPRALTNGIGAAAGLNDTPILFHGKPKVTVAQGGASVTNAVVVTLIVVEM